MATARRRGRAAPAVLVVVALVLLTADYREDDLGPIDRAQQTALTVFAPLQAGAAAAVRPLGAVPALLGGINALRRENSSLRADLLRVAAQRRSQQDLSRQLTQLRGQLRMRKRLGVSTLAAEVIARPPAAFDWSVLIDRGARAGLRPGMAVVNGDGLVGRLVAVTRDHARVQLLASPSAGYAVRLAESGKDALLSGSGPGPFGLEVIDQRLQPRAGEQVVTRAFAGTRIPAGVPVGVVAAPPARGPLGWAAPVVRPYVDFTSLDVVSVVTGVPSAPARLDRRRLRPDPDLPALRPRSRRTRDRRDRA